MSIIKRRVHAPSFVLFLSALWAGAMSVPAEQLPIKTYTTADGLARDTVNRIIQDSHGFLWFATSEGLSRFDGYRFTNYGPEQGLPSRVNDLMETRGGVLWIATEDGLYRFNPNGVAQPLWRFSRINLQPVIKDESARVKQVKFTWALSAQRK